MDHGIKLKLTIKCRYKSNCFQNILALLEVKKNDIRIIMPNK